MSVTNRVWNLLFFVFALQLCVSVARCDSTTKRIDRVISAANKTHAALNQTMLKRFDQAAATAKRKGKGAKWDAILKEKAAFERKRKLPRVVQLPKYEQNVRRTAMVPILEFKKALDRAKLTSDNEREESLRRGLREYRDRIRQRNPGVVLERTKWTHPIGSFQKKDGVWIERIHGRSYCFEPKGEYPDRVVMYDRVRKISVGLYDERCVVKVGRKKARTYYKGKWVQD